LPSSLVEKIEKDREEIKNIIAGKNDRKILIIGPCSAWPEKAVLEYAKKLQEISEVVKDKIKIVMRVYSQKPRTAKGWSGPLFQPNPFEEADVQAGLEYVRRMMIEVLEIGLPIADEALFLESGEFLNDIYSYVALGARSAEDHSHRVYASALDFAVGVKNPSSGDLEIAKNSVWAVNSSHTFLGNCGDGFCQKDSSGNKFGHLVLRGGSAGPNYNIESIEKSWKSLENLVENPAVVIDLNHNNSGKKPEKQPEILKEVMEKISEKKELKNFVKGFMVESFLKEGNQNLDTLEKSTCDMDGLSVTDGCLGWEKTEKMILDFYKILV